jgi:hypothetical protein
MTPSSVDLPIRSCGFAKEIARRDLVETSVVVLSVCYTLISFEDIRIWQRIVLTNVESWQYGIPTADLDWYAAAKPVRYYCIYM